MERLFSSEASNFDPLGINSDAFSGINATWESFLDLFSQSFESSTRNEKSPARGVAGLFS